MKWIVQRHEKGLKLGAFLKCHLGETYSSRALKGLIEANRCRLNNRVERHASTQVREGDVVLFSSENYEKPLFAIDKTKILFEDEWLLLYDKPPGLSSDGKGLGLLFPQYHLVHRLDKETSGVIILAKTQEVLDKMVALFRRGEVKKNYLALVYGVPQEPSGVIENRLGRKKVYEGQTIWGSAPQGLRAKTSWRCQKIGKQAALIACYPETGRTHQLRVHLKEMGHPILGDYQYGRDVGATIFPSRCLLHAAKVSFVHPITRLEVCVEAPLPADFRAAMKELFA